MFHLQFHWYGFLIGLGILVGVSITESILKKRAVPANIFWQVMLIAGVGSLIGARAWHVLTDIQLYQGHWWQTLAIWNGGLSIIGAVAGALIVVTMYFQLHSSAKKYWRVILDATAIGLPVGQAIGRVGNFANQELYGLPSHLPWAIYIDPAHRLVGFQQFSTFHPLFAYESLLMLIFAIFAWKFATKIWPIGTGLLFLSYIVYYSWIRFGLDFLRIDKVISSLAGLGINQVFLLLVGLISTSYLLFAIVRLQKK